MIEFESIGAEPIIKKRINTVKKGDKNEHKSAQYFRNLGYDVIVSPRQSWVNGHAIAKANDYFGLWDLIAVKQRVTENDRLLLGETVFIQVKTNKLPPKEYIKKLIEFYAKNKFLMIWHDRKKEAEIINLNDLDFIDTICKKK